LAMLAYNLICRYRHIRFHAECRIMPDRCQVTLPGLALALRSQFGDKLNSA
jgi:hypothetical protein